MGLVKYKERISREEVYKKVDDAQIFSYYFGQFSFSKSYPSVFRRDLNPSTGFYVNRSGHIIYNDIASGEKLDAFAFVAKKYTLSYRDAIHRVACDFGLIDCVTPKVVDLKVALDMSNYVKKETIIDIEFDKWTEPYLDYWRDYSITLEELEREGVKPIKKVRINGQLIPNYRSNMRFAFVLHRGDKCYKKIYEPHAEKKYRWFSSIPLHMPFGHDSLTFESDTLIICKSVKEKMLFNKYFTDVLAVQNESPASLRETTIEYLKGKYKNIYLFFDIDEAGLEAAKYYEEKGLTPIYLPLNLTKMGIKDSADFVKHYGIKKFEDFLKYNKVL